MLKPFVWMFSTENFKKHFLYLFFVFFKFVIPAIILYVLGSCTIGNFSFWSYVLSGVLFFAPLLCIQGYFWELTSQIISREWDIEGANINNGKIKQIYQIKFPELNTRKFIWRGIASIVANFIMFSPLLAIFYFSFVAGFFGIQFFGTNMFENPSYYFAAILAWIIYGFLTPALLWNYAKQDSVVAVLNYRKAIYIAGNYTGKYILNCIIFIIFNTILSLTISAIFNLFSINTINLNEPLTALTLLIFVTVIYVMYIYCTHVNSYLLGTITPPCEG